MKENQVPLVLMVSSTECPYCERLKEEFFHPMLKHRPTASTLSFKELLIDLSRQLTDFAGDTTDEDELATRYDATLTPTVLFLGPDGVELAERMVGVPNFDFYPWYFEQRLEQATKRLRHALGN